MSRIFLANVIAVLLLCYAVVASAQIKQTTICNPLNLSYRFQLQKPSRREAADPTVVLFKGKYYLFASKSGCYWSSNDLINWTMITSGDLPWEDYAPTVVAIKDTLYFMASNYGKGSKSVFKSGNPLSGKWQVAVDTFQKIISDPDLFLDDDGRLYFFYGTSNQTPIYGVELDKKSFKLIGEPVGCLNSDKENFGWERTGDYNTNEQRPFIEGAWMNKFKGKYYLQYAAPGTEFKSYVDAVYVANAPLGPFKLAAHNPFSYKPEGFIAGAGHGSTFQDKFGNYWHIATMTISVKHMFERRLGLFPAFFDKDGLMYAYTAFGDFPHRIPQKRMSGPEDFQPTWMLLSYHQPVEVSSALPGHPKENITNEDIRKYWSAETGNKGEWALIDLHEPCKISAVQINFAEDGSDILGRSDSTYYQYLLDYSTDKKNWEILSDKRANKTDAPHDYLEFATPVTARYLRLSNYHVPSGRFALSGLRVFGKGNGKTPRVVSSFTAIRDSADGRNVTVTWKRNDDAIGFNIGYGIAPDKLYENYQVLDTNSLTIHSLSKLQTYYFTIDAFNRNGVTRGMKVKEAKRE